MRLLITRPEADAAPLAGELADLGHETVIEPLLEMQFHTLEIDAGKYRAVLATSANGVRALVRLKSLAGLLKLEMFAVGPASAHEAREAGFEHIHIAGGDVTALASMVAETLAPGGKPLLHVSGAAAAGDLKGALEKGGFMVERMIGYEARARAAFSPEVLEELVQGGIDGVLIYSPRTAVIFTNLMQAAGLAAQAENLRCYCLSQAVADKLHLKGNVRTLVAAAPNQPSLLKLIADQG